MIRRLVFTLLACGIPVGAVMSATPFPQSVRPLPPTMRRAALAAEEKEKPMLISVALRMRHLDELQARVANGELIPRSELEARYLPLTSDFEATARWLKSEGLDVAPRDSTRLAVFAHGSPAQLQSAFGIDFAAVEIDGERRVAATSAPVLPDNIAMPVLAINGLQPLRKRRPHLLEPQISNAPPYYPGEIVAAYNGAGAAERGTTLTGAGETIAIVIDVPPSMNDLTQFWAAAGVSQTLDNYSFVNVNGGTLGNPSGEESLDAEWTSGTAPGAKVRVYCAGSLDETALDACFQKIIDELTTNSTIHELSISLGIGETFTTSAELDTDAQYFMNLASAGVSVFVSSGDGGSTPDDLPSGPRNTGPLQVESYASDPSVTGVGGTTLNTNPNNDARTTETAWYDSGGGASIHFGRPTWQTGPGSFRTVPDVSLPADPHRGAFVVLGGANKQYGGTSWGAPTWAGVCALMNQARALNGKTPLGLLNPRIYPLAGSANFYDIVSGNNASGANSGGNYSTTDGYDEVTGLGSPNIANLVTALAANPVPSVGSPSVVISQVYGGGGQTGATYKNDFIELYNRSDEAVDLSTWSVQFATGTVWSETSLTGVINPGAYYLIWELGNATGAGNTLPAEDQRTGGINLNTSLGKVALVSNQTTLPMVADPTANAANDVVDFVGYGTVNAFEGSGPTPALTVTTAALRKQGGAVDTNDNASDFTVGTPTPHNSATLANPDLTIALSHSSAFKQADAGDTYSIVVSNAGGASTRGLVSVAVALPSGLSPVSIGGPGWATGADLQSATRTDSLAAGASYPPLAMTVSVAVNAGSPLVNEASAAGGGEYNGANDFSLDATAITALTPSESWRYNYFGITANSGPAADGVISSGDGLPNLLKYAFGLNPLVPAIAPVLLDTSTGHLSISATRNSAATDVTFSAQVTSDLSTPSSWNSGDTHIDVNNATMFQAHDLDAIGATPRFIRLQVTRP